MLRSTTVKISLVSAIAVAVGVQTCDGKPAVVRHCVDVNGNVVDDENCDAPSPSYRYWYGGYTPVGVHASGGSYTAPHSGSVPARGAVARGGFGSVGAVHGGEGS